MSDKNLESILKEIKKKHGNIIVKGNELLSQRKDYKTISLSPAIDLALKGGIREGTWLMLSGAPKSGKAQPLDSTIYTPDGPMPFESIAVGDEVCGADGKVCIVRGIYPQGIRKVYKILFSDGTSVECDGHHLWPVHVNKSGSSVLLKTTEELLSKVSYPDRDKWKIMHAYCEFNKSELPLDPFVMGVILADGYIDAAGKIYIKSTKPHIMEEFKEKICQYNCGIGKDGVLTSTESLNYIEYIIKSYLKSFPEQKINSRSCFIVPRWYKYNSIYNRNELLRGYLGSNGYLHSSGYYEVESANVNLLRDMAEVSRSLGYPTYLNDRSGSRLRLTINHCGVMLHALKENNEPCPKEHYKTINLITHVGDKYCQCIEIDKDGLYLTDGFNVTHNTTTAMQLAFNCQQEGRPVIYINAEGRLSEMNFDVRGLDPEKMQIITAEDKPLSAEIFLDTALQLISAKENVGALCIIDSVSSLIPSKELDEDVTGMARPGLPKILSNFVKKAGQIVPNNKITMCMITHLITNTSGYGPSKMADSGVKIQYQADTRMEVKSISPWEHKEKQVGQAVNWKIYYSSKGATGLECQSWIRYGEGIDSAQELLILGEELSLISKAGAWYTLDFLKNRPDEFAKLFPEADIDKACKFQGQEKVYNFLNDNKPVLEMLQEDIFGMLT
jgi:RecA/RadA recombinase